MKQLTFFTLIFISIFFPIACKKNSQNNNNAAAIVGKWNNISTYKSDGTHLRSWTGGQYITFRDDKTFDEYGNMFDYASSASSSAHGGVYTIGDDSLRLMWSNGKYSSCKVQTLTNNSLVLRKKGVDLDVLWDYSK
ncbi:MAG: lipocalin family protein [Chitinophagales bacterium]|nr:lipocalin family protein [Chitinophagales bacterium]